MGDRVERSGADGTGHGRVTSPAKRSEVERGLTVGAGPGRRRPRPARPGPAYAGTARGSSGRPGHPAAARRRSASRASTAAQPARTAGRRRPRRSRSAGGWRSSARPVADRDLDLQPEVGGVAPDRAERSAGPPRPAAPGPRPGSPPPARPRPSRRTGRRRPARPGPPRRPVGRAGPGGDGGEQRLPDPVGGRPGAGPARHGDPAAAAGPGDDPAHVSPPRDRSGHVRSSHSPAASISMSVTMSASAGSSARDRRRCTARPAPGPGRSDRRRRAPGAASGWTGCPDWLAPEHVTLAPLLQVDLGQREPVAGRGDRVQPLPGQARLLGRGQQQADPRMRRRGRSGRAAGAAGRCRTGRRR